MATADPYPRSDASDVDALMRVSRVITGIVATSLLAADGRTLTLPQLRALVLMGRDRVDSTTALAEALEVHVSSASRLVDRLVAAGLVSRSPSSSDRRQSALTLTTEGWRTLSSVMEHRRSRLAELLSDLDDVTRASLAQGLNALADAADATHEPFLPS